MDAIDGYYDIPWAEVDTEAINGQLLDFQVIQFGLINLRMIFKRYTATMR